MTQELWSDIKSRFHEARELHGPARQRYLSTLANLHVRREVESLLAADNDEDAAFIEHPRIASLRDLLYGSGDIDDDAPLAHGLEVGAYRIVRSIGAGGMGEVYLAERADGSFDKRVAIKVLRADAKRPTQRARFDRERRTLAALEHPNIARLIDGGTLEDGRPFLVLEYIEGLPIDTYCDEQRLSTTARIELFRQVLDVVRYAHANLIVHRDLKPSNIFVTDAGIVKLLDFGIAKLTTEEHRGDEPADSAAFDPRNRDFDLTSAAGEACPFTLEYASPEQIRRDMVTTATDVYSLGMVLYRLLTGCNPYDLELESRRDAERVICNVAPTRPSTAVVESDTRTSRSGDTDKNSVVETRERSLRRLRRRLTGDLDGVLLRALAKSPEERYASVERFDEDLDRWLAGRPVRALPHRRLYRAWRTCTRHPFAFLVAIGVIAGSITFVVALNSQTRIAVAERDRAEDIRKQLEASNQFLEEMLQAPNPDNDGRDITVIEVIDRAAASLDDPPSEDSIQDSETRARLHTILGNTYIALGKYEAAMRQHRNALDLRERQRPIAPQRVGWSLGALGRLYYIQRKGELARDYFEHALSCFESMSEPDQSDLGIAINNLASAHSICGDFELARACGERALALRERYQGADSVDVAESLNNLANYERHLGNMEAARRLLARSLAIREQHYPREHPLVAQSLGNLGVIELACGNLNAAESLIEESLARKEPRLGKDHPDLAFDLTHLAVIAIEREQYEQAARHGERALSLRESALGAENMLTAMTACTYACALTECDETARADEIFTKYLALFTSTYGESSPRCQRSLACAARCAAAVGDEERAAQYRARCQPPR